MRNGADPNRCCRWRGVTALHKAAWKGHLAVVKSLLTHGANPDSTDFCHRTPRDMALAEDKLEVVDVLSHACGFGCAEHFGRVGQR